MMLSLGMNFISSRCLPMMLSASASMTIGVPVSLNTSPTALLVASSVPKPGPIAIALYLCSSGGHVNIHSEQSSLMMASGTVP